ncbi:MAG: hypothetical protein U0835_25170 [Isosphaeraceae bacterium]
MPAAMADLWVTGQFPEWTFVSLLQLWLAWRVFRLLSSNPTPEQGAEAVAFDAALADRRLFRRWISRTAAARPH